MGAQGQLPALPQGVAPPPPQGQEVMPPQGFVARSQLYQRTTTIAGPSKTKEPAPKAAKKANKTTALLDMNSDDFAVLGSNQLSYNLLVREDHESGEVMVCLQPKYKRIPKEKRVVARPPPKPKNAGVARVTSYAMNRNPKAYNEHRYARASPTVMGKINGYEIPMLIDSGSEICHQ